MNARRVAVLCCEPGGPYFGLPVDCFDAALDARSYRGGRAVVAHPPCGPWGKLRHMCVKQDAALGPFCVEAVRRDGGVLEHPAHSLLWGECGLPEPGEFPDEFGGWSLCCSLSRFGSPVRKLTWLYLVGIPGPIALPRWVRPSRTVESLHSRDRQLTPPAMARWLVELAGGSVPSSVEVAA